MDTRSNRFIIGLAMALSLGLIAGAAQASAGGKSGHLPPRVFPPGLQNHIAGISPQGASHGDTAGAVSQCPNSNAEVDQAVDGSYVYEAWIGCSGPKGAWGIGFARSTNGGRTFGASTLIPGSTPWGFFGQSWDPALAVAPDVQRFR